MDTSRRRKGLKMPKLPKLPQVPKLPKAPKIDVPNIKIDAPKIDMPNMKNPKIDMPNAPGSKPPKNIVEAPYKPPKTDAPNTKPKVDAPNTKPKKTAAQRAKDIAETIGENAGDALEVYNAAQQMFGSDSEAQEGLPENNNDGNEGAGQPVEEKPAQENQDPLTKPLEDKANSGGVQAAAQNVMASQGDNGNKPSRDSYLDALNLINRYEAYGCQQPSKKPNPVEKKRKYDF